MYTMYRVYIYRLSHSMSSVGLACCEREKKYIYIYTQYRVYFFPNLQECDKIKLFAFGMVIGEIFDCKSVEIRNAMTTTFSQQNLSDSFVTGCYCWGKKVISVLSLNLNQ